MKSAEEHVEDVLKELSGRSLIDLYQYDEEVMSDIRSEHAKVQRARDREVALACARLAREQKIEGGGHQSWNAACAHIFHTLHREAERLGRGEEIRLRTLNDSNGELIDSLRAEVSKLQGRCGPAENRVVELQAEVERMKKAIRKYLKQYDGTTMYEGHPAVELAESMGDA